MAICEKNTHEELWNTVFRDGPDHQGNICDETLRLKKQLAAAKAIIRGGHTAEEYYFNTYIVPILFRMYENADFVDIDHRWVEDHCYEFHRGGMGALIDRLLKTAESYRNEMNMSIAELDDTAELDALRMKVDAWEGAISSLKKLPPVEQ